LWLRAGGSLARRRRNQTPMTTPAAIARTRDYPGAGSEDGGEPDPAEERDQHGTGGAADDE
jgi:hypothetical protein